MKMLSAVQTRLGWPDVVKHKIFNVSGYGRIYHIIERVFNFLLLIYISITKKRDRVFKKKKKKCRRNCQRTNYAQELSEKAQRCLTNPKWRQTVAW